MARPSRFSVESELRGVLPREVFEPRPERLAWLFLHVFVVVAATLAIARFELGLAELPLSLLIGASFAGLAFVAHETLHGAVVRDRRLRRVIGFVSFAPFCLSPRLWMAWHNRVHHGHTNEPGEDPDAYPTLAEYETDARARLMVEAGAPGSARLRGLVTLFFGLSVQSAHMLLVARRRGYLSGTQYRLALLEACGAAALWLGVFLLVGPLAFVQVFALPLVVANVIVMAHITTNHSLSPVGEQLDTLDTSLSVSVPRVVRFVTLGFGYHVEHHLFPSMSGHHAPRVQAELRRRYPERYQCLPLARALWLVHTTPRVHAGDRLVDPRTGRSTPTLPRLARAERAERRPSDPPPSFRPLTRGA